MPSNPAKRKEQQLLRRQGNKESLAASGNLPRPPGAAPAGMRWDGQRGWVPRNEPLGEVEVPTPDEASGPRRSIRLRKKMLHVSDEWLEKEHPNIGEIEVGSPVDTPSGRHVKRHISAITSTSGGSKHVESEVVAYTIPPPDESASEHKRRSDRVRR